MYAMPAGYRVVPYGRYKYYYQGGIYYYPYMFGGRTVYVQVDVNASGQPLPPPPPSQIQVEINL